MNKTARSTKPEFSDRLYSARLRRGFTQEELAQQIGLTRVSVSNMEAGAQNPKIETLHRLCSALVTTPDYFLGYRKKM